LLAQQDCLSLKFNRIKVKHSMKKAVIFIAIILSVIVLSVVGRNYVKQIIAEQEVKNPANPELVATAKEALSFSDAAEAERFHAIVRIINAKNQDLKLPREIKPSVSFEHIDMQDNSNMIEVKFRFTDDITKDEQVAKAKSEFRQMKMSLCAMMTSLSSENQAALFNQHTFYRVKFYDKNDVFVADNDLEMVSCVG
jgi:hypothetical protein